MRANFYLSEAIVGVDTPSECRQNLSDSGTVVQLGERVVRNDDVVGSILIGSTTLDGESQEYSSFRNVPS